MRRATTRDPVWRHSPMWWKRRALREREGRIRAEKQIAVLHADRGRAARGT